MKQKVKLTSMQEIIKGMFLENMNFIYDLEHFAERIWAGADKELPDNWKDKVHHGISKVKKYFELEHNMSVRYYKGGSRDGTGGGWKCAYTPEDLRIAIDRDATKGAGPYINGVERKGNILAEIAEEKQLPGSDVAKKIVEHILSLPEAYHEWNSRVGQIREALQTANNAIERGAEEE